MIHTAWYERLSSIDSLFLELEDRTSHMHVGAVATFEGPPPPYADFLRLIDARLEHVPRYRQRVMSVPAKAGRPVWVDETQFDLEYHARHTALPAPGGEKELKKLAARLLSQALDRDKPLYDVLAMGRAPESPLNVPIGPHRRFEMLELPLAEVKEVRANLGGTVNDVILATVAGGLRRWLTDRGAPPQADLRVLVPVSMRTKDKRGTFGNQVSAVFCPLPVTEASPIERLKRIREEMKIVKEKGAAVGAHALSRLSDFAPPQLLAQAARLQAVTRMFNLVVTNVPGPQFPLYLLGRRMLRCYPQVPLAAQQAVGIALLSYDGRIGVGLIGDADAARDLPALAGSLRASLDELRAARSPDAAA